MKREGKKADKTYQLFEQFLKQVIANGKSLLTEDAEELPLEAFEECYKRYIDNTIEGSDQSYDDKIEDQFEEADPETELVLAHAIWLWAFGVSDKRVQTKKRYTTELIGNEFSLVKNKIYPKGVGSAGQWHSQNKYYEIAFTFLLIRHLRKQLDEGELKEEDIRGRIEKICLYQKYDEEFNGMEKISDLKTDLPSKKLAIANILLHFADPEKYEPIASDNHKKKIVDSFGGLLDEIFSEDNTINRDQKIKGIREEISRYLGDFNFYDRKLKKVWNYSSIEKDFDELPGLEYKKAIVLYGPPGTSKTYSAKKLAETLITKYHLKNNGNVSSFFEQLDKDYTEKDYLKDRIHHLQLHPSYTYEDFVAGMQLRNGETKAEKGKLFTICDKARKDQKEQREDDIPHVLILDEINRVDLSLLFGEVFSALENREEPVEVSVQNKEKFELSIPRNLYVIGTMNEIDFSLERIDFALRRRFLWIAYTFNKERLISIINEKFDKLDKNGPKTEELDRFARNANALNDRLTDFDELNNKYEVGHTFFAEIAEIYYSYLKLHNKDYLQNKIYKSNKSGPAQKLWEYSIEPIIDSFLGSINEKTKKDRIKTLADIYFQE